jgi:23S rRNA (pseudouridine1915-N3)-methyltransferase
MAGKINKLALEGKSDITFIIGGSLGLSNKVLDRADEGMSFGKMTFPHQLMRLILLEQIFRSFKIIKGETYHK